MAESALATASAATPSPGIKQEHDHAGLEGLDFTLSPEIASKRPFEDIAATSETSESKRAKNETETEIELLEDDLALLVQNALSNVGDLVDQATRGNDVPDMPPSDPIEVDATTMLPELPIVRPTFAAEPLKYVRDANIHALGNLALSILLILVQAPFGDTIKLVRGTDSDHKRSFHQLKTSFEHVRQLYSAGSVLSADQLDVRNRDSRTFIELANMAQLGLWLVDGSPKALSDADDSFLALFQCQLSDLSPGMTELYLGIKTQRAIEFLVENQPEKPSEEVIGEVLTQGLEDILKEQHGGGELTSADQSFVSSVQTRKETLQGEVKEQAEPAALRDKHPAEDLLRSYLDFANGKLGSLTDLGDKLGVPIKLEERETESDPTLEATGDTGDTDLDMDDLSSFFEKTASGLVQNALAGFTDEPAVEEASTAAAAALAGEETSTQAADTESKPEGTTVQTNGKIDMTDYKELEALVAESTSNYVKTTLHGLSPVPFQPTVPTSTTESMASHLPYLAQLQHHQAQNPYHTYSQPPPEPQQPLAPGQTLPPNQTFSSAILYDKARQAALSKSSAHTRREGLHSTRRPWTQEEEKALMAGLDTVKGPHWSQILTLFGHNGTISDILKDRTQVQLKDKARNLKLFFLKTNSEMPYYLQAVTGELKTRAPTQAARKEAEERARLTSEEDQAKLQGIMALAGGLQHPPRTSASPASAAGSGVVTPAQAATAPQAASSAQHQAGHQHQTNGAEGQNTHASISIPRPTATPASQALQRPHAQLPPQVPRPQGQHQQHSVQHPAQQPQQSQQPQQQQAAEPGRTPPTPATPQRPTTNGQSPAQPAASQQSGIPAAHQQPASTAANTNAPTATAQVSAQVSIKVSPFALPTQARQQPHAPPAAAAAPPTSQQQQHQHQQPPQITPPQEVIKSEVPSFQQEQDDNAAEAALLEGLQAVVAQTLAS
ncbi:hypothetical protein C2857_002864 [Epichloe festucae Fl1]|uniref:HTH myb-type domain-containing protein n=1 Tax=Epichloe festucae (strain Fl1) TaxID=877507 RepID=A0A7U3Q0A0_EPIFF|nr:hypothetical protein C2857_002864 [Epichloe festucae Fl1]